jgi:hypothetical protein
VLELVDGDVLTDDGLQSTVRALVGSLDQAARLAKHSLDAGIDERREQRQEHEAIAEAEAVRAVVRQLRLRLEDPAVERAVRAALTKGRCRRRLSGGGSLVTIPPPAPSWPRGLAALAPKLLSRAGVVPAGRALPQSGRGGWAHLSGDCRSWLGRRQQQGGARGHGPAYEAGHGGADSAPSIATAAPSATPLDQGLAGRNAALLVAERGGGGGRSAHAHVFGIARGTPEGRCEPVTRSRGAAPRAFGATDSPLGLSDRAVDALILPARPLLEVRVGEVRRRGLVRVHGPRFTVGRASADPAANRVQVIYAETMPGVLGTVPRSAVRRHGLLPEGALWLERACGMRRAGAPPARAVRVSLGSQRVGRGRDRRDAAPPGRLRGADRPAVERLEQDGADHHVPARAPPGRPARHRAHLARKRRLDQIARPVRQCGDVRPGR